MGSISYHYNYGTLVATLSENDTKLVNGSNKVSEEIFLGKVINKENLKQPRQKAVHLTG